MKLLILLLLLLNNTLSFKSNIVIRKQLLSKSYDINNKSISYRKNLSLLSYTSDEENKGISPKILGLIVILGLGIFGSGFIGTINGALKETSNEKVLKKSIEGESRGSMTKLTRREINVKLQQLPLFYATKDGSVYIEDGIIYLFIYKFIYLFIIIIIYYYQR